MTHKENITAILECYFTGFKKEIIDSACNRILEQEPCGDAISRQAVLDFIKKVCFSREQECVDFRVSQGSNGQRDLIINFIEDLPPVNLMPCEDAISREMALKECHDIVVDGERYRVIQEETLLGLPSVNPTKTGHWIDGWVNKYKTCPKVTCSECGIDGTLSYKEYKYCPNCGARMIEQEESEE